MNRTALLAAVSSTALLASACSSTHVGTAETPPPYAAKALYEYKVKTVKEQVEIMPGWYLEPPSEEGSVFAVGSSVTPDLQLSVDLAILQAKTTLADRFQSQLRSQTKSFVAKVGSSDLDTAVINEVERVTKNLVADTDVSGYSMVKSKVNSAGSQYRAFVLLKYNDEEASKILLNRLKKDRMLLARLRSNSAFKELDNTVEEAKKAKARDKAAVINSYTSQ
jgi:hypothetical protein